MLRQTRSMLIPLPTLVASQLSLFWLFSIQQRTCALTCPAVPFRRGRSGHGGCCSLSVRDELTGSSQAAGGFCRGEGISAGKGESGGKLSCKAYIGNAAYAEWSGAFCWKTCRWAWVSVESSGSGSRVDERKLACQRRSGLYGTEVHAVADCLCKSRHVHRRHARRRH